MSTTNGGPQPQIDLSQMPVPRIGVLTQYVKDFSFENPNAPRSMANAQQPAINVNIGVEASPLSETDIEVTLRLDGKAEAPRMLFPFAREIIATATRNGGFPPLLLEPIDFVGLYRQRVEAAQAEAGVPPLNPS
jgi:preprotein translocase subunit SecB